MPGEGLTPDLINELEQYRRILNNIPAEIGILDTDGRYLFNTPSGIRDPEVREWMLGKTNHEWVRERGHPIEIADKRQWAVDHCVTEKESVTFEEIWTDRQGRRLYYVRTFSPVKDEAGTVTHVLGYGQQITQLKKVEEELRTALAEVEALKDRLVYVWADGIYVKAGLERDKAALLVVLGAMRDGTKEVLALRSGYRESVESWSEVLRDLKARGIEAPRLLMADGNAAIWGAVRQVWPEAGEQRCWNHKMRNVLDRLPQREQSEAKDLLRAVVYAPSRSEAVKAREVFARRYRPWYPKAVDVLEDDWERMVAFYDFPEDHWKHLRTTNVVESPFAALRLRTTAAKRFKRVESATALIWKLLLVAEKRFRRLDAPHLLKDVFEGRKFEDGKPVSTQQRKNAA